jgi:hypothetical protein
MMDCVLIMNRSDSEPFSIALPCNVASVHANRLGLQVLGDTAAAGVILDRFLHHAEVVRLQGRSYRMYNRKELHRKQAQETLTGKTE